MPASWEFLECCSDLLSARCWRHLQHSVMIFLRVYRLRWVVWRHWMFELWNRLHRIDNQEQYSLQLFTKIWWRLKPQLCGPGFAREWSELPENRPLKSPQSINKWIPAKRKHIALFNSWYIAELAAFDDARRRANLRRFLFRVFFLPPCAFSSEPNYRVVLFQFWYASLC